MPQTVGIVGIGIMGSAMARNLIKAGFAMVGYDPVPAARNRLEEMGGRPLASPKAVAEAATITFASLPSAAALADAIGGADGIAGAGGSGQIVIECSTLPLAAKREAHALMSEAGKIL